MIVVSDSSPLIALARIGKLDLLPRLFPQLHIPLEVYDEVVVAGSGKPGAEAVANANWIQVTPVSEAGAVRAAVGHTGLGAGEVAAVLLANEIGADLVVIDEAKARRFAVATGLAVIGCVGALEALFRAGHLADLRASYVALLAANARIDLPTLQKSLAKFDLPAL